MKRALGVLFVLLGAFFVYIFAAGGMFQGRDALGTKPDLALPFLALGRNFPADTLLLLGTAWLLMVGVYLILTDDGGYGEDRPPVARLMLINALLLVSTLVMAYVAGKAGKDAATVTVFAGTALLQAAAGLILLVLALFERPKGAASLLMGAAVWLFGVGVGVLAFVWGA